MNDIHKLLREVETYAKAAGLSPEAVCRAATRNPRLYDRLKRRAEQTDADVSRLEKYMRNNPPESDGSANRHKGRVGAPSHMQGGVAQ
ncbi:MAG: hypothetical protein ABJE00_06505 [Erythrobacter sp.]